MKATSVSSVSRNKNILYIALGVIALLMVPLIAMQFTSEVNWSVTDFIIAGALLFGTGLAYELISRRVRLTKYRILVGAVLFLILVLVWIELAVGIFD